ncbi:methyl-accepting chemotaxis protein, partial [Aurantimonas sp. A2-1-M11]
MDAIVDLEQHRARLVRLLALTQLAVAPIALLLIALSTGSGWTPALASAGLGALCLGLSGKPELAGAARMAVAVALVANISIVVATMTGSYLQVDMHMAYFAGLAVIGALFDWRVILGATIATALHHVFLNFLIPSAIYPGGSDLARVSLHAVILLVEAGILIWLAVKVTGMFAAVSEAGTAAREGQDRAEALNREAAELREAEARKEAQRARLDDARAEDLRAFVGIVEVGFERLSAGDLTVRMQDKVAAEFEPIRAKFNASVAALETAIGHVVTSIASIRTGLGEINTASNDLAHRTEQQAASLEETVAALGEVTQAVNETAEGAGKAQLVASGAREKARKGGEIVGKAVT